MKMSLNSDDVGYLLDKAKSVDETDVNEARIWLLVGKSLAPQNFKLHYEAYLLEKRRRNAEEAASTFEPLARKFLRNIDEETTELANSVLAHHFSKGKETEEQKFLLKIFTGLPKEIQLEILMHKSERTPVLYEKCQCSLLLVKLYPDTVHQHGADLLFSVLSCESDAFSTFRKLLVVELVPAVLQLNSNFGASPKLLTLLNLCVEYYILVTDTVTTIPTTPNSSHQHRSDCVLENIVARLDNVFKIVDRVGTLLNWKLCPFFKEALDSSSLGGIEAMYQNLQLVFQNRHKYNYEEIAYISAIAFLACVTAYSELSTVSRFGETSKLHLVEVFCPHSSPAIPQLSHSPILTVSNDPSVGTNHTPLVNCFQVAVKIWLLVHDQVKKNPDQVEQEFANVLLSLKSLNFEKWVVFQNFLTDYNTYVGLSYTSTAVDTANIKSAARLASLYSSAQKYKYAAEQAIKLIEQISHIDKSKVSSEKMSTSNGQKNIVISPMKGDDFSFFNSHIYTLDGQGHFITQRRVHFISENHSELIHYATNVLIHCFERVINDNLVILANEDCSYGHLLTLLQLEWPSSPAESLFLDIFERIKRKGSFSYYPFFDDFILEPDFLEQFASMSYDESCKVVLDFFGTNTISNTASGSRRIATRGVDKGTKEEFREAMAKQMSKNGLEKLEDIIARFIVQHKDDILKCFS